MMNFEEQMKYAVYYGCWDQKIMKCGNKKGKCGTDTKIFKGKIQIPTVIPDGTYAFVMTWFGGLTRNGTFARWPDYHSCAFVRVKGGPITDTVGYQPFFKASAYDERKNCRSAVDSPGICRGTWCRDHRVRATELVPRPFQNGKKPKKIYYSDYIS